jgi:hypothetical protein
MKQWLIKLLNLRRVKALGLFLIGKSALHEVGWFKSSKKRTSINAAGEPIPWLTYSVLYFLVPRITKSMNVFEYGSGNSTLWWAAKVKSVMACENNLGWYTHLKSLLPPNAEIVFQTLTYGGKYSKLSKLQDKKFDIVVVDGRDRVNCALNSVAALNKKGVIVWDNTDRERYQKGINRLLDLGFKKLDFFGMAPIDNANNVTSIFYKKDNCLGV